MPTSSLRTWIVTPDGVSQGHFNLTPHSRLGLALIPNYNARPPFPVSHPRPPLARRPISARGPHPCPTAGHPSFNYSSPSTLNFGVTYRPLTEKISAVDDDYDLSLVTFVKDRGNELTPPESRTEEQDGSVSETASEPILAEQLGRGRRHCTSSTRLNEYITYSVRCENDNPALLSPHSNSTSSGMCIYPIANFVSCDRFSDSHTIFLAEITLREEPLYFKDAVQFEVWRKAMGFEVEALEATKTWSLTELPPGKKALASKWVYRIKYNSDGSIEHHKARLVVMGNFQEEGIDYDETFAPVVKMNTVRILLQVASARNWELHQMDVHNAFLHGDINEEIYMKPRPGFQPSNPNLVCKLNKSLYGLRQAPHCWFSKLSKALLAYGFVQCRKDYSLFTLVRGSTVLHILVYVDDLVINDSAVISQFKNYLNTCFRMKDLGLLKYFLGIEVYRGPDGIYLSQRKYCLDIFAECGLSGARLLDTPLE
ncbi:unnamed protein product [Microthlaspi erraticum]|uniref:Reverse transcriptase Ty1/copia-type domain-containing protein n=1 Tax=Microthlaspi erraticum TaxID=1685480 RepID=A0A6D2JP00_9BRAS|nr:unnamed protein product [Microthlaspi erraticum]